MENDLCSSPQNISSNMEEWNEGATLAARGGKASILSALYNLFFTPQLPGGAMGEKPMAVNVNGTWRNVRCLESGLVESPSPDQQSIREVFKRASMLYADQPCLGSRKILAVHEEDDGSKTYELASEYTWLTYSQAYTQATDFGRGLVAMGMRQGMLINFYADTCAEWQLACQGCFDQGIVPTTTYTNLGSDAVCFAIQQAELSIVFTDAHLVDDMMVNVVQKCPLVKTIVYIPSREPNAPKPASYIGKGVEVVSFQQVCELGSKNKQIEPPKNLKREDLAVLMYTSGSTAMPKGVLLSNGNLLAVVAGTSQAVPQLGIRDTILCYLPSAHIMEMVIELSCLCAGVSLGYGTPKTLTANSPNVCKSTNTLGDAAVLRPTLFAGVPLVFDKVRSAIQAKVNATGGVKAALFHYALKCKMTNVDRGKDSPIWDLFVFDKLRTQLLGGRVRFVLSGGGPLSHHTQLFINAVLCCPVGQGYGATETTGVVTTCWPNDRSAFGKVGAPILCNQIKLEDWPEAKYFSTDKPNPRGEILVGGPNIAMGYYKMKEKTDECFVVDAEGVRWFRTEDIGQIWPNGVLQIIDRKKDLAKLSGGEYVSYGKLEPLARDSQYVDNCFFYARPTESFVVAVVSVKPGCEVSDDKVFQDILTHMRESKACVKFEYPKKIKVVKDVWTPENDLLTAASKLKRFNLERKYANELDELYGGGKAESHKTN